MMAATTSLATYDWMLQNPLITLLVGCCIAFVITIIGRALGLIQYQGGDDEDEHDTWRGTGA